jgi:hypothetical protein
MRQILIFRKILTSTIIFLLAIGFQSLSAQVKKPTLMILPSDNWCSQRYFITTYDNQGVEVSTPNYQQAFVEDQELPLVVSKIGQMLTNLGYSLKDAEQETKAVSNRAAEENLMVSKESSASIAQSPLDIIKQRAKMDIIVQIWWKVNKDPQGKSVSFTLEAFDAYTSKRIATSSGTGPASDDIVPVMLEQAVVSKIADFDMAMMNYYNDMNRNGREIVLTIKKWDDWDNDLETEYDGEELLDCIQNWLSDNTINGNFNLSDATENFAQFEQVRIPLVDEKEKALDARGFAKKLRKYLSTTYQITSKLYTRGLGDAILVLGEK